MFVSKLISLAKVKTNKCVSPRKSAPPLQDTDREKIKKADTTDELSTLTPRR